MKQSFIACAILADAVAYILDQFPIIQQKDERTHGSYHTTECILEIYDTDWCTGG